MRILVISNVPWDNKNSYGNTISNWFEGWNDCEFFNVFCRSGSPCNNVCNHYYTVPPITLMMNILRPSHTGYRFEYNCSKDVSAKNKEDALIQKAKNGNKEWMYLLTDMVYSTCAWQSDEYKSFIKNANPDIVFSFASGDSFIFENIIYVKKHTRAKIVLFIADDIYGAYKRIHSIRNMFRIMRFNRLMLVSDLVYCASEEMKNAYQNAFKKPMYVLYKGCKVSKVKTKIGYPLKLTYAGNLMWGRADSLGLLARILDELNIKGVKATLSIYTNTFITQDIENLLNLGETSKVYGPREYEEIVAILHDSDIVLHVESFRPEDIETVKYSFSTKIIDCLQSGSVLMTIGPAGIASVEYSKIIPGAYVICDVSNFKHMLSKIINERDIILDRAIRINTFAKENHEISTVRMNLRKRFNELMQ